MIEAKEGTKWVNEVLPENHLCSEALATQFQTLRNGEKAAFIQ
jgi:hypothetical protein